MVIFQMNVQRLSKKNVKILKLIIKTLFEQSRGASALEMGMKKIQSDPIKKFIGFAGNAAGWLNEPIEHNGRCESN